MADQRKTLILIAGPTAVGKTDIAIDLAKELKTEIISADGRQFYKEMSIGTAKPSREQLAAVPHHFIDNKSITELYSAGDYEREVDNFLKDYFLKNDTVILCGGTGLYIKAVLEGLDSMPATPDVLRAELMQRLEKEGLDKLRTELLLLDPESIKSLDLNNTQRVIRALELNIHTGKTLDYWQQNSSKILNFSVLRIGLNLEREQLYARINQRVHFMLESGLLSEAEGLKHLSDLNALQTVGYTELFEYFSGKTSLDFAIEKIKQNTRRYAKRQLTWFRNKENLNWFGSEDLEGILDFIKKNC
jgi:tRNA dimethylallyltransferase